MYIRSPKDLALFVVNQRKKLNLSQSEVAKLIGIKQPTLSSFENKPQSTKLETLFHILSAVNLDMSISPKDNKDNSAHKKQWKAEW